MKCELEDFSTFSQIITRQSSQQTQLVILATEHETLVLLQSTSAYLFNLPI